MSVKKIGSLIKQLTTTDTGNSLFNPYNQFNKTLKVPNNTMLSSNLLNIFEELNVNPLVWPLIPFYAHKKVLQHKKGKEKFKQSILKFY